jgi:hypothetical protein
MIRMMVVSCILALSAVLGFSEAMANDTPIRSVGKAIQPRTDVPVRLVSEDVKITISGVNARVDCIFNLLNEGPAGTIEVGFPRGAESGLNDFTAKIDNETATVETVTSTPVYVDPDSRKELPWWKTFKVPFTSTGQTVVVRNTYWTRLGPTTQQRLSHLMFTYIMTTGAPWKGTIGEATFTVSLDGIDPGRVVDIKPEGFLSEGNRYLWRFTDFEPASNIEIQIMEQKVYDRLVSAEKLLAKSSGDARGHFLLGTVYWINMNSSTDADTYRDYEEKAKGEFLRAIEIDPALDDARWYLAVLYNNPHNPREMKLLRGQLEAIIAHNPSYRCRDELFHLQWIDELKENRADKWLARVSPHGR